MSFLMADEQTGIGAGTPAPTPPEAPVPTGEPESDGDSGTPEEDQPDENGDSAEKPRRKYTAEQRINRLTRDKYELAGRLKELERRLSEQPLLPRSPESQPPPQGKPEPKDYPGDYEAYVDALTDYKARQSTREAYQSLRQEEEARRIEQMQARAQQAWQERVGAYRKTIPDFDAALQESEDIALPPYLQYEILTHEHGPQLAYELAKQPAELARIAGLPPAAALRALGQFETRQNIGQQTRSPAPVSKAPEPIKPLGTGSATSTKNPGTMDYQEYKRWWAKQHGRK